MLHFLAIIPSQIEVNPSYRGEACREDPRTSNASQRKWYPRRDRDKKLPQSIRRKFINTVFGLNLLRKTVVKVNLTDVEETCHCLAKNLGWFKLFSGVLTIFKNGRKWLTLVPAEDWEAHHSCYIR